MAHNHDRSTEIKGGGSPGGDLRVDELRRLAEQAMNDPGFRAAARDDLDGALHRWGYDLTDAEMSLVRQFRASLAEAHVDLDLVADFGEERLRLLLGQ